MRAFSVAAFVGVILGCAGAGKHTTGSDVDTADGIAQDPACADYLDCLAAVDPTTLASVQATYGTSGTCWADAATAAQCATACETGLSAMDDAYPDEAACDDGGALAAGDLDGDWTFRFVSSSGTCTDAAGVTVTVDPMNLTFRADDATHFSASGTVTLTVVRQSQMDVTFDCTLAGDHFTCARYAGDEDTYWTLAGTHTSAGIDASVEIEIGDGSGNVFCTDTDTMAGTR